MKTSIAIAALIILCAICVVTCYPQATAKDSLMIKQVTIRIAELQSDLQKVTEQKKQLEESVLRIEGALFILNEQKIGETKRLDSLNVKKKP